MKKLKEILQEKSVAKSLENVVGKSKRKVLQENPKEKSPSKSKVYFPTDFPIGFLCNH